MSGDARRVLILGGTGFVGRELGRKLCAEGYRVTTTSRRPDEVRGRLPFPCEVVPWDGASADVLREAVEGSYGVVNLAGEGIADRPWSGARRRAIRSSRVDAALALARAVKAAGG